MAIDKGHHQKGRVTIATVLDAFGDARVVELTQDINLLLEASYIVRISTPGLQQLDGKELVVSVRQDRLVDDATATRSDMFDDLIPAEFRAGFQVFGGNGSDVGVPIQKVGGSGLTVTL